MRKHTSPILAALALLVGAHQARAADWLSIKSTPGQFSLSFPVKPEESTLVVPAGSFQLTMHVMVAHSATNYFTSMWNDYPPEIMAQTNATTIFNNIAAGYEKDGKKKLSDKPITVNGKPGRLIEADVGNGIIHSTKLVMAGNRLYQTYTECLAAQKDSPDLARFRNGFAFWLVQDYPQSGFRIDGVDMSDWAPRERHTGAGLLEWQSRDALPNKPRGVVKIEVSKPASPTLGALAASLAKSWNATVSPEKLALGGEPAVKLEAANTTSEVKPVYGIVSVHEGRLYCLMGGAVDGVSVSATVDQLAKGWKWQGYAIPVKRLDLLSPRMPMLGNLATIVVPADMFANDNKTPDQFLDLSMWDARMGDGPFQAYIQLSPLVAGQDFLATRDAFLKNLNTQKLYDDALTWTPRNGDPNRVITVPSHSNTFSEKVKHDLYVKWALLKLDGERMVLINFTIVPDNRDELARFDAAAVKIVDSIQKTPQQK